VLEWGREGGKELKKQILPVILVALVATSIGIGQGEPTEPPTTQKPLAASLNVYVFPVKGQAAVEQSQDEASCYTWAVQNAGVDPFDLQKKAEKQEQQTAQKEEQIEDAGKGAGAKGAVGGAAAVRLITTRGRRVSS